MFQNPSELVSDVVVRLQDEQHHLSEAQAREVARKLYPKCDTDENGRLFVRLASGVRVKADSSAAVLLTNELFHEAMAPKREADVDRRIEELRRQGYGLGL